MTDRNAEAAIAWAQGMFEARLIEARPQQRWRPQYFLTFETDDGPRKAVLRGYRNPGYTSITEDDAREFLAREADILAALQRAPVSVPAFHGHNPELGWLLMEFVEGEAELTAIEDADRRFRIYRQYVEELARLHACPIAQLGLSPRLPAPDSCRAFARQLTEQHTAIYRSLDRKRPEPTLELGLQWVADNAVPDERPVCLGLGDVGPNQFLFAGDEFRALIDVEYGIVGDPLMEMGMMRGRDVTYHTGRMPEHILHYGKVYEELTGIPLSMPSLQYWTIAGPALWNVFTVAGTQNPDPAIVDTAFLFAYEVQQKRCILDGMSELYGFAVDTLEQPSPRTSTLDVLHETIIAQLEGPYRDRAADHRQGEYVRYSAAIAETLRLGAAHQLDFERANLEELGELLGDRIEDLEAGLWRLEQRIRDDYRHDLEARVRFLSRFEQRRDILYRPMQAASGVSQGQAITPMAAGIR